MRIVRKQRRVLGRMYVRTPAMDTRVPNDEVWLRSDVPVQPGEDLEKLVETMIRKNPRDACDGCAFFTAGRYGLGKCGFHKDTRTIDDTCPEFEPRLRIGMLLVNPVETTDKYRRERQEDPSHFDSRSFRTVREGKHRVVVGCPRGQWDNKRKTCKVGTRVQTILHPKGEENPCDFANPRLSAPSVPARFPTGYNPDPATICPRCGGFKSRHAKLCGECTGYTVGFTEKEKAEIREMEEDIRREFGPGNPAYPTETVKLRTEKGEAIEVQVPADWERMRRAWEEMHPIYQELFNGVADKTNWKLPIGPIYFAEYAPAQLMADAIIAFHGGSEIDQAPSGGWIVSSKGYYEYTMGA